MKSASRDVPERAVTTRLTTGRKHLRRVLAAGLVGFAMLVGPQTVAADSFVTGWEAGVYDSGAGTYADWGTPTDPFTTGPFDPLAGAQPFVARTKVSIEKVGATAREYVRDVKVQTPPGLVVNPQAVPTCSREEFYWRAPQSACPPETQVGRVYLGGVFGSNFPVYNLEPRRGVPAEFGFLAVVVPVTVEGRVGPDGTLSAVSLNNSYGNNVQSIEFMFYGMPGDPAYGTGSTAPRKPFITTPTSCVGPVETLLTINSWQTPEDQHFSDTTPVGGSGCAQLPFDPVSAVRSTSQAAGAPTGLDFELRVPQSDNPDGRATAHVKRVEVELPEGMTVNPAAADGLAGCSLAQVDLDSSDPVGCPAGSKIGSVEVETPLLEEKVGGSVYLASPHDNPFGSLLALYVVAENAERGVRLKIPGRIDADPVTGRLTATFDDNPQLPYTSLRVRTNGGQRAPLMNPSTCGTHEVVTRISPWSAVDPDNPTPSEVVEQISRLEVTGCASGFSPLLEAGSERALARASSPFVLAVSRGDRDEEIASIDSIELPTGLLGDISGVAVCESAAADAGSCPAASRIGRVQTAVGSGPFPAWLPQAGKRQTSVSLAGPYRGAPYSLSVVVPAQAGPFDLGNVVVRSPLHVDIRTAQLSSEVAQSRVFDRHGNLAQVLEGRVPTILEGIPLRIRDIRVIVDRDGFMLNPSDCSAKEVDATVVSVAGGRAAKSSRYNAAACRALPFDPRLGLRLTGRRQVKIGRHPGVRALVRQAGVGEAGIRRARVVMPDSLALDPDNARALCEFEDGTKPDLENHCPAGSKVGRARARTPLLNRDLVGDVYFVKNVRRDPRTGNAIRTLPMLVVALRGEIDINLVGESDTARNGRLINTFNGVPDAPISRFNLNIRGGKNGILAVTRTAKGSENLCERPKRQIALTRMAGHNGKPSNYRLRVKTPCTRKQVRNAKRSAKRAAKRSARRTART